MPCESRDLLPPVSPGPVRSLSFPSAPAIAPPSPNMKRVLGGKCKPVSTFPFFCDHLTDDAWICTFRLAGLLSPGGGSGLQLYFRKRGVPFSCWVFFLAHSVLCIPNTSQWQVRPSRCSSPVNHLPPLRNSHHLIAFASCPRFHLLDRR